MADPLSIAGGSFAVVGVVNVVLRASIECRHFLSEIKDAPADIHRLKNCIKENTQLVESLKEHLDHLRDPATSIALSKADLSSTLDAFNSSVRALHRELNAFQILVKKYGGADTNWARIKWALDGRKISKSLEKLERSKATLSVALSLVEGRKSASAQKRIENSIQENFQQITSTMGGQLQELSAIRTNQERVLAGQEKITLHSTQQLKESSLLLKAARKYQIESYKTQGKIADGNKRVIDTLTSKLEDLRNTIPNAPSVARHINRQIYFTGARRESILPPLLLMKEFIQWATLHIISDHADQVYPQHLYFLRSEFDNLVSSAIQEAAASCQGSTATSFDQWTYSSRSDSHYNTAVPQVYPTSKDNCERKKRVRAESHELRPRKRSYTDYQRFSFRSPVGELRLTVPRNTNVANVASDIDTAYFSFVPPAGISNAISARFVKLINSKLEPRLYTQLNAFRLVEDESVHLKLFARGSIEDIDAAFRNGTISPYDQCKQSILSLEFAARYSRRDVLEYLENQGVGMLALNGESDALGAFWARIQCASFETTPDSIFETQAYFDDRIDTCIVSSNISLLSMGLWNRDGLPDEYVQPVKAWMGFLKRNGYNFDLRDNKGHTHLLDHLRGPRKQSLAIVRLLLEFGADPHLLNSQGCNAIQIAMSSNSGPFQVYGGSGDLEEKLDLLIKLRVNPRHRDEAGNNPSFYARYYECWLVWCRALERNGIKIDEVIEEGEEELLQDKSVEYSGNKEYDEENMTKNTTMKNLAIKNANMKMPKWNCNKRERMKIDDHRLEPIKATAYTSTSVPIFQSTSTACEKCMFRDKEEQVPEIVKDIERFLLARRALT